MADVFPASGVNTDSAGGAIPPSVIGSYYPSIDQLMQDGLKLVTPWGGGTLYRDTTQNMDETQTATIGNINSLVDLLKTATTAQPITNNYVFEGMVGPQGPAGPAGPSGIGGIGTMGTAGATGTAGQFLLIVNQPTFTGVFSSNSPDAGKVSWTTGTLSYQGVDYTIDANATGTTNAYIYWDIVSSTVLQSTNNKNEAVGVNPDRWVICYNDGGTAYGVTASQMIPGSIIIDGTLLTDALADNAVTTAKLAALCIDTAQIVAGAVTETKIATSAITETKIATDAVTSDKIIANAVTAAKIIAGAVTTGKLAAGAVTANEIAALTITASQIAANAVTAAKILAGEIGTNHLAAGSVTAVKMAANSIVAANIVAGTITANEIAAATITAANIAALTITASKIIAGAIETDKINELAVTTSKVADDTTAIYRSANTAGSSAFLPLYSNWLTIQSVAITSEGGIIDIKAIATYTDYVTSTAGYYRLLRGTTQLGQWTQTPNVSPGTPYILSTTIMDSPGVGTFTYYLQGSANLAGVLKASNRVLSLNEPKGK